MTDLKRAIKLGKIMKTLMKSSIPEQQEAGKMLKKLGVDVSRKNVFLHWALEALTAFHSGETYDKEQLGKLIGIIEGELE